MRLSSPEQQIASFAVEAMLHEATAGPKPGLVDPFNSGAHDDMDLFTFCSSASVLHPYFASMAREGRIFTEEDPALLLIKIRPIGIEAENAMFGATCGINTHKGLIFSLGILCAAAGYAVGRNRITSKRISPGGKSDEKNVISSGLLTAESLCRTAAEMCRGIVEKELANSGKEDTNGEKLFLSSGATGIRGEAEAGFPSVLRFGLHALRRSHGDWNSRLIDALLHLMTTVEDSNVLHRGGAEALGRMRELSIEALRSGGALSPGGIEILRQMDLDFTERNISPGGCADLLAVTIFLYRLENYSNPA